MKITSYMQDEQQKIKHVPTEEMAYYLSTYGNARMADLPHRVRGVQNMKSTLGLFYDIWPDDLADEMLRSGRDPKTYNFHQKYVAAIAGNYIANSFSPKLINQEDDSPAGIRAVSKLNNIYFSDRDVFNYKQSEQRTIWNGCVYRGVEELQIIRTADEPRGRIAFVSIRPDMIIFDPDNTTDDVSRKAEKCWKEFYLTHDQMLRFYDYKYDELQAIKQQIEQAQTSEKKGGANFDPIRQDENLRGPLKNRLGKHLVVEYYHIEWEKEQVVIDGNSGYKFQPTGYKSGSEEDFLAIQIEAATKGLSIDPENLHIRETKIPVLYLTTLCQDYNIVLENRKDERQLNGHIPFYCWAYVMKNGVTCGVVDFTYDAVQDFNKREMAKTRVITQTQISDKPIIHPLAFGGKEDKKREMVADFNDPTKPYILDEDAPPGIRLIDRIPGSQIPQALIQDESFKLELISQLANVPPAMFGQAGNSAESGISFGRKVIEGNITHRPQIESLQSYNHDKTEDWTMMAIRKYGGKTRSERISNYNRSFSSSDGSQIVVNDFKGVDSNGNDIVDDDIASLKRVQVIIVQSKENDYQRQAKVETDTELLKAIPQVPANSIIITAFSTDLVKSAQYEDEDQKKKMNDAADMAYQIAMAEAQKMLASLQQPPQPPQGGAPGGSKPPEGGPSVNTLPEPGAGPDIAMAPGQPPISAPSPVPGQEEVSQQLEDRTSTQPGNP